MNKVHEEHYIGLFRCDGVRYIEFGDMTLCENEQAAIKAFNNYEKLD